MSDGKSFAVKLEDAATPAGERIFKLQRELVEAERLIDKIGTALSRTRGQWIHSVNSDECLSALNEFGKWMME